MANRTIVVDILANTASYVRGMRTVGAETGKLNGRFAGLATSAKFAAGSAGIAALTIAVKAGVSEWVAHEKVAAQTNAVLKSTGNVAGITAKHVGDLATEVMNYSGIDDEAVQATENLLLGFTKIRNEAGKGNDVFDRTTKLVEDYAVRTGKDASSAAVLFGKALQDIAQGKIPKTIRGVGSLSAETQKEIQAHLKAGDVVGAQAVLLTELEKRYKGAAEAAGKTLPGQLEILKQKLNNLAGAGFGAVVKEVVPYLKELGTAIQALAPILRPIGQLILDMIVAPLRNLAIVVDLFQGKWGEAWDKAKKPLQDFWNVAEPLWNGLKTLGDTVFGGINTAVDTAWNAIKTLTDTVWGGINTSLTTIWNGMQTLAGTVYSAIQTAVTTAWNTIKTTSDTVWSGIKTAVTTTWNGLQTTATTVWSAIKTAITTPINLAKSAVTTAVNAIKTAMSFSALKSAVSGEWNAIKSAITGAINAAKNVVVSAKNAIRTALNDTFKAMEKVPGKIKDLIVTPVNKVIDAINSIHIPGFSLHIDTHLPGVGTVGFDWGGFDPFHIPKLAQGGIVTGPTVAMIGEAGPEAVVPLSRGGLGGGMNVTVTVYAATSDPDGLAQQIVRPMVREIQKYARGNSLPGLLGT